MYPEVRNQTYELGRLRWSNLLERSAQLELARQARAARQRAVARVYGPVMARVGVWLVRLGTHLQASASSAEAPQTASGGLTAVR